MAKKNKGNRKSIHESNLEFWNSKRIANAIPNKKAVFPRAVSPVDSSFSASPLSDLGEFSSSLLEDDDYAVAPFNTVGKLVFRSTDHLNFCGPVEPYGSAWIIGPRTIMTVAHNIYESNCGAFSTQIAFLLGFNSIPDPQRVYSIMEYRYVPEYLGVPSHGLSLIHI